jgi:hypothetical protein
MRAAAALLLLLGACSGGQPAAPKTEEPQDLESAAIERGLVRDPKDSEIAGLYGRDTDRLCILRADNAYRAGAFVDYGDGITCSGSGTATRAGETIHLELGEGCSFDARFDGEKIRFPGALADTCAKLCTRRASFAGLEVSRMSESEAEAAALRDADGKRLCGS